MTTANHEKFQALAEEMGCTFVRTGKGLTSRIKYSGIDLGYMNSSITQRGGCFGYRFRNVLTNTKDNDAAPSGAEALIRQRYGEGGSDGLSWYVGQGSNSHRRFLCINSLSTAEHILRTEIAELQDRTKDMLRSIEDVARLARHVRLDENSNQVRAHCSLGSQTATEQGSVHKTIVVPAAKVRQGELVLYTTSLTVRDLITDGFYSVETLDPEDINDKGYQRLLNKARAKKLADYIVRGQDSQDAFLPTSVFLATDKSVPFDASNNTIAIDIAQVGPFSVVDGQHRLEGLKLAAAKDPRVLDFEVPVNIAISLPKIAQMCHFLIVNTTQKSVDKAIEQRIIARLTDALDIEDDLPSLPKWIQNVVEKGEVDKAVKFVDFLNESIDSPWHKKVHIANSESADGTVNQKTFVKAIVRYVLNANNPLTMIVKDFDKERRIFLNYWRAIANILDDGNAAVLYKYNGVELFCKFSIPFFIKLQDRGSFSVQTMESLLQSCFENIEGDYAGVGHPDWWAKGSRASFLNASAINVISHDMTKALHSSSSIGAIEL